MRAIGAALLLAIGIMSAPMAVQAAESLDRASMTAPHLPTRAERQAIQSYYRRVDSAMQTHDMDALEAAMPADYSQRDVTGEVRGRAAVQDESRRLLGMAQHLQSETYPGAMSWTPDGIRVEVSGRLSFDVVDDAGAHRIVVEGRGWDLFQQRPRQGWVNTFSYGQSAHVTRDGKPVSGY